jgi:hypothetical protein
MQSHLDSFAASHTDQMTAHLRGEHSVDVWLHERTDAQTLATLHREAHRKLRTYVTMTVEGGTGSSYLAEDIGAAAKMAEADGYNVLDLMDDTIVIAP